jgi:hypothetical protein
MKKILFAFFIFLPFSALAQESLTLDGDADLPTVVERIMDRRDSLKNDGYQIRKIKSHINLEFAGSANAYFTEGKFDETSFKMNRVRLEIYGRLHDQLSYHFRQSFNKYSNPYSVDNMSSSIEYAYIKWHHASGKFDLFAGKHYLAVAGYEGYVNGLLVREFSDFNNNVEIYQAGVMGVWKMHQNHHMMFQVTNNRNSSDSEMYLYGLPDGIEPTKFPLLGTVNWNGWFADRSLHLMYSASAGQLAKGKNIYYLMCGNIYEKGPVLAYLDVLYSRSAIDSQQRITTLQGQMRGMLPVTAQNTQYLTLIANVDYQFSPKWNAYLKGVYETAGVYEANGIFEKGRYLTSWNAQACIEWFPFTEDKGFKVFGHLLYKGYHLEDSALALGAHKPHTQRISLGIQYIIPVL